MKRSVPVALLVVAAFLVAAWGLITAVRREENAGQAQGKLRVVTTVSPLTNIVENIGGDRIDLQGLIPEGTDSHTYEPTPSDARALSQADLIIVNGLGLEEPALQLAEKQKKPGAQILKLGDQTITEREYIFDFSFPKEQGYPNPHLWLNPQYVMNYARLVRDKLVEMDPENEVYYRNNAERYLARLAALDRAIEQAIQTIPPANRRLLTYHDSWAYFARRYGLQVIGAIQPADFLEPSAQDVARIIDQVRRERVPALFGSEVFPSPVLERIAQETGARYVDKLRDDDLPGKPGEARHSYIGLMLENMEIMIPALGGHVESLKAIDPSNVAGNHARYPQ